MARNEPNELRITRVFDAPLKAVWNAWTDPSQLAHWWGPRGFTITTHSRDFRVGGTWVYTMHGPDGKDWPNITKYLEINKYSSLLYDHGGTESTPPMFRVSVTFAEADGKTTMDMRMILPTPEAAEETRKFVKKAGGDSTWDRLAEYLEKETAGNEKFFINRSFNAPIERMWDMWTNPAHLMRWLAPTGTEMEFYRSDIRVGGSSFYRMEGPGMKLYGRTEYVRMDRPNLLVYKQQFCDEHENLGRHPLAPDFPASMMTAVRFTAEDPETTRVTVVWEPCGDLRPEEMATFLAARSGMTQGWTGSFDKLEEALAIR